ERYVNNVKEGSHSDWSDTDVRYSPHEGIEQFPVPVFGIKPDEATVLFANPDSRLTRDVLSKDVVKFFVHPDIASDLAYLEAVGITPESQLDEIYMVTPTSSTRTLLTQGREFEFMVKTDLDKRHYRFIRRLKGSSVDHSIRISQELERITSIDSFPEYAFLPESLGVVVGDKNEGAGVLFREVIPRPIVPENRVLIPYFSLYATDLKSPDDLPILIQLVQKNASQGKELEFFTNEVIGKIVRTWTHFATEYGLLLELHGQNTLLEVDEQLRPQRMIHRDFQSIYIDKEVRETKGLSLPVVKHVVGEEQGTTKPTQYSIAYDHQVGDFLFDRLSNTFRTYYSQYSYDDVAKRVREMFRSGFGNPRQVFPRETYTYGKQEGNEVNLIQKHTEAIYR
ncbi:MAG: IucA/IucC family protein, partial [Patescibacteria group bacterium]